MTSLVDELAKSMLARTMFPRDPERGPGAIWRAQPQGVRDEWRQHAADVIDDLARAGYEIEDHEVPVATQIVRVPAGCPECGGQLCITDLVPPSGVVHCHRCGWLERFPLDPDADDWQFVSGGGGIDDRHRRDC